MSCRQDLHCNKLWQKKVMFAFSFAPKSLMNVRATKDGNKTKGLQKYYLHQFFVHAPYEHMWFIGEWRDESSCCWSLSYNSDWNFIRISISSRFHFVCGGCMNILCNYNGYSQRPMVTLTEFNNAYAKFFCFSSYVSNIELRSSSFFKKTVRYLS